MVLRIERRHRSSALNGRCAGRRVKSYKITTNGAGYPLDCRLHVLGMDEQYDVVVVGAGVEGSSTAYNLVRSGSRRVLLLEQASKYNG